MCVLPDLRFLNEKKGFQNDNEGTYIEDDELRRKFVFLFIRRRMFDTGVSMEEGRRKKIKRRVFWSFPVQLEQLRAFWSFRMCMNQLTMSPH